MTKTNQPTKAGRGGPRENSGRPLKSTTPTQRINVSLDQDTLDALARIDPSNRSEAIRIAALAYKDNTARPVEIIHWHETTAEPLFQMSDGTRVWQRNLNAAQMAAAEILLDPDPVA